VKLKILTAALLLGGIGESALAQTVSRFGVDPPVATNTTTEGGATGIVAFSATAKKFSLAKPTGYYSCRPGHDEVCYDLTIGYATSSFYNPIALAEHGREYDRVELRAYIRTEDWLAAQQQGSPSGQTPIPVPVSKLVGPLIEMHPGQTARITLRNQLPAPDKIPVPGQAVPKKTCADVDRPGDINTPYCGNFNRTNLHSHGLWVSPAGNSDNVLISIDPGSSFQYEYNLPPDHPAGTFWYHSHLHGSTAAQVSSGMAGALIVRGDRLPTLDAAGKKDSPGDLDVLLDGIPDRTFVLQQVSYGCRDANGSLTGGASQWRDCGAQVGNLEPGAETPFDHFGPGSWTTSRRFTSINGTVWPIIGRKSATPAPGQNSQFTTPAVAGQPERWRMIHAGVRDTVRLQLRYVPGSQDIAEQSDDSIAALISKREREVLSRVKNRSFEQATDAVLQSFCPEPGTPGAEPLIPVYGVASDGLTRNQIEQRDSTWLQPGYREDMLVSLPKPGIYCLVDQQVAPSSSAGLLGGTHGRELLGYVVVKAAPTTPGGAGVSNLATLVDWLVTRADGLSSKPGMNQGLHDAIVSDLRANEQVDGQSTATPRLALFTPHEDITLQELSPSGQAVIPQTVAFRIVNSHPGALVGTIPGSTGATIPPPHAIFEVGEFTVGIDGALTPKNSHPYSHDRIDRTLKLDTAEEWWLTSFFAGHPFHIHVNPFQIVGAWLWQRPSGCKGEEDPRPGCKIDPKVSASWLDLTPAGATIADGQTGLRPSQYAGLKGVWGDTLFVEQAVLLKVRSRYQRYIGDFVLHCHILDHEDEGMMQNVRIVLGDGAGHGGAVGAGSTQNKSHQGH